MRFPGPCAVLRGCALAYCLGPADALAADFHRSAPVAAQFQYTLPFLMLVLAIFVVVGMLLRIRELGSINRELRKAHELAAIRERERDQAQDALLSKLQDERELAKQRMQFEAQLNNYEKYAALAQLALGAAHEINNPLLGIQSHLELEANATTDTEEQQEIQQCIAAAKRISAAVRGLLNYARPGPLMMTRVNLDRLVADTVGFLEHQPLFHNVKLVRQVEPEVPQFDADANQLSQVLMNLLLNSAQAMSEGGVITITAGKNQEGNLAISIRDTGCGIPPDILPHVFDPFFSTKRSKGTGLGLSISQAYMRSHGGDIRIESRPGEGTVVHLRLPLRKTKQPLCEIDEEVVA